MGQAPCDPQVTSRAYLQQKQAWGPEGIRSTAQEIPATCPLPSCSELTKLLGEEAGEGTGSSRGLPALIKLLGEGFQKEMVLLGWLFSAKGQLRGMA